MPRTRKGFYLYGAAMFLVCSNIEVAKKVLEVLT